MARFFFDTHDGLKSLRDDIGLEFPDAQAARLAAIKALPDIARDRFPEGDRRDFTVDVRDERSHLIYTATLSLVGRWTD